MTGTVLESHEGENNDVKSHGCIKKALFNASYMFILSAFTKIVNIGCNIVLVRYISKEAYGVTKIYLEIAFLILLFFPRETLRKTAQKFCSDKNEALENIKFDYTVQLVNLMNMFILLASIPIFFFFLLNGGENVSYYKLHLLIYILSANLELIAEPVILYMNIKIENKQVAVTIGNFARVLSNCFFAMYFGLDLWSFTLSRIFASTCITLYLFYIAIARYKINLRTFLPNFEMMKIIYSQDIHEGINIAELRGIFFSFFKLTSLKMVLTYCEKIILGFVLTIPEDEKSEYSFVVENASFFIRFLLEPLEENFFNLVNKLRSFGSKDDSTTSENNKQEISFKILKLAIRFMLIFGMLLVFYFYFIGREVVILVFTEKWASESSMKIFKVYTLYIAIIAINGIVEAFANATNTNEQMSLSNRLMIINSCLLIVFSIGFSKLDVTGLIWSNSVIMLLRMNGSLYIMFKGLDSQNQSNTDTNTNTNTNASKEVCSFTHNMFHSLKVFFSEYFVNGMSFISILLCIALVNFIRNFFGKRLFFSVAYSGTVFLINLCLIFLFERKKVYEFIKQKRE